ncbi:acetyl/propionyl/methylcrotonyl-CoA carboxylase subunit alpha [Legionella impletisoli]|uniref:Biotin carboxylase n=1 Tax=Legionella impletisoli TaxID=343510 RepID=A0A917N9B0_9GAMM|nr:acetyl/propionyl/methylcrotonyl-CoA carboxylase subunit alpha [Legionella impletisoli]GGI79230.1 acyl CoA carboxylase subunit alpha [Legionella impletisoli]
MFTKILIANRGEIACRIIRTAKRLGIETVAVYSSADADSLHVKAADEAFYIGNAPSSESYLNIDAIIKVAVLSGAEAIHPGYGFLSENPKLAEACLASGLVFIGPSISAMKAMASKQIAKQLLENTDVPLTPGYHGEDQSDEQLLREAKRIGFPVLLKAAAGGGGKGMRTVNSQKEFLESLASARREAKSSFGDDTMLIEKLLLNPRHVELQIMADNQGNVVHLFDRDCSIQRRHQKIIEEAPAPNLSQSLRDKMAKAAITVAQKIDYRGAGTIEFLVSQDEEFYFMEMNTRLQVEHPVTECITGIDLVEWQLCIAANEPLPLSQDEITQQGHAIECRICAEDPSHDFMPSIGQLSFLKEPTGEGIRIDSGVTRNSNITMHYDPMISKLITFGETRTLALNRMHQALADYHISGVKTNLSFLQAILNHPKFAKAELSTDFLTSEKIRLPVPNLELAVCLAASLDYCFLQSKFNSELQKETFAWQMHLSSQWRRRYLIEHESYEVLVHPISLNQVKLKLRNNTLSLRLQIENDLLRYDDGLKKRDVWFQNDAEKIVIFFDHGPVTVARFNWEKTTPSETIDAQLIAPMPSTVVAVLKKKGDKVKTGDTLMVLEAMKMEHAIIAPQNGLITDVYYEVGNQVNEGVQLVELKSADIEEPQTS